MHKRRNPILSILFGIIIVVGTVTILSWILPSMFSMFGSLLLGAIIFSIGFFVGKRSAKQDLPRV